MSEPLLVAEELEREYRIGPEIVRVLRGVTLTVEPGESVAVIGASGVGKSTLLHVLGMHDGAFTGEYEFLGYKVHALGRKDRQELQKKHIGFVFQSYHLLDDLTVYENLEVPLSYRDVKRSERQAIVGDVLDRFHIVGKKDLYPSQLSGGQQQLVGVARAVVANPKVILADEPTGNLHTDQGREIMRLFQRLNDEGTTIVQVTHSEKNAEYGNKIVELHDGWIVRGDKQHATA